MPVVKAIVFAMTGLAFSAPALPTEPLTLGRTPAGHMTVNLAIDGQGPYLMVLDTGASETAIAYPIAQELGFLAQHDELYAVQSLTVQFEAERFMLENVQLAGRSPISINSVVLPSIGEPIVVVGYFAPDSLNVHQYAIDFANSTIRFDQDLPNHADGIYDADQGLLVTAGQLGRRGERLHVMIDTGSSRTLVNGSFRARMPRAEPSVLLGVRGVDRGRPRAAQNVNFRDLQIAGLCIERGVALYSDLDIFNALGWVNEPAIILGMDFLQNANLVVDRETGIFELTGPPGGTDCGVGRVQLSRPAEG